MEYLPLGSLIAFQRVCVPNFVGKSYFTRQNFFDNS